MTFNENECMNFRLFFKCLIKMFFSVHASLHVLLYAQIKKFFIEDGGEGRGGGYECMVIFSARCGGRVGVGGLRRVSGLVQGLIANLDNFNNHINLIILKFPWAPYPL